MRHEPRGRPERVVVEQLLQQQARADAAVCSRQERDGGVWEVGAREGQVGGWKSGGGSTGTVRAQRTSPKLISPGTRRGVAAGLAPRGAVDWMPPGWLIILALLRRPGLSAVAGSNRPPLGAFSLAAAQPTAAQSKGYDAAVHLLCLAGGCVALLEVVKVEEDEEGALQDASPQISVQDRRAPRSSACWLIKLALACVLFNGTTESQSTVSF